MSRHYLIGIAATTVFLFAACINNQEAGPAKQREQRLISITAKPGTGAVKPPALPKDKYLTYVGGEYILPAYKTKWERQIERLSAGAKAGNLSFADQYDDYRKNNFDKFFITKAPTSTSFRAPAEYEPSQAYILHWAQYTQTAWNNMFGEIVKGAWGKVPVLMVYNNAAHKLWLEGQLTGLGYTATAIQDPQNIIWWKHDTDAIWARDYGPVSLVSTPTTGTGSLSFVDFRYYHARVQDDVIPTDLAQDWGINVFRPDLDMEPGNFMNTEDGLCGMTKGVLWYNPQLSQSAIEDIFTKYVACQKFVWPEPMSGGVIAHIDMFSKFGPNYKMIVGEYTQSQDASNKAILDANATLFGSTTTPTGKTIAVTRIPMPNKGGSSPNWVWRTYTNSLSLTNGTDSVILVPVFAQETSMEAAAMTAYATVYPGWTQAKVTSDVIIPGQGATHCITMQIPLGTKAKMETDPTDLCGPTKIACVIATCGNIGAEGCCDGTMLKYCDGGKLAAMDCTANPSCGWDSSSSWYDCGTSGGADPSSTYVKNCGVLTDAPLPDTGPDAMTGCGNVTFEGCCDGETVWYCENAQLEHINCALSTTGPKCSWDSTNSFYDCGTSGAADPSGTYPQSCGPAFGDAGPPPTDGETLPDGPVVSPCGSITYEGCCEGETLTYCQDGALKTLDCSNSPSCGWQSSGNFYDCGTDGSADPSGKFPKSCSAAKPDGTVTTPDSKPAVVDQSTAQPDQSTGTDGATKKDGGGDDDDGDGCGCRVGQDRSGPSPVGMGLLLFGLAGLVLVRRRARR